MGEDMLKILSVIDIARVARERPDTWFPLNSGILPDPAPSALSAPERHSANVVG